MTTTPDTILPPAAAIGFADAMLDQCRRFLADLDDDAYTAPCDRMFGSTIGAHVRHSLDHFRAAITTADGDPIDYDRRDRDTDVERSAAAALGEVDRLRARLATLHDGPADRAVRVRVMVSGSGDTAELTSTLARELDFAAHHAVHHHAMIGAIAGMAGLPIPDGFGKAPSTIEHERRIGA